MQRIFGTKRTVVFAFLVIFVFTTASFAQRANPFNILQNFEGLSTNNDLVPGGVNAPHWATDATGAVGPNHYFQITNYGFAIYDKQGHRLPLRNLQGIFPQANPVSILPPPPAPPAPPPPTP